MALSELERRIVATIEESWMGRGSIPSTRDIANLFGISEATASKTLQSEAVREAFKSRGVPETTAVGLTPSQVTAINTIVNPMDTRSRRKKLQDMGVTSTQWAGWMKQPKFQEYMKLRAESLLTDAIPEAHMALVDNVLRGEFNSIKFLYEMTGHYDGNRAPVDIPALVQRIIEIISIHVQNPETLLAISQDLLGLAHGATVNTRPEVVQGEYISDNLAAHLDEAPVASVTSKTTEAILKNLEM